METASSMEAAAAVKTAISAEAATPVATAIAAIKTAPIPVAVVAAPAVIPAATIVTVPVSVVAVPVSPVAMPVVFIARMSVIAVVPRTCADEDATREPLRSVKAIGRAGVRIIVIVAIGAYGGRPVVRGRPNSHADNDALRVCIRSRKEANAE